MTTSTTGKPARRRFVQTILIAGATAAVLAATAIPAIAATAHHPAHRPADAMVKAPVAATAKVHSGPAAPAASCSYSRGKLWVVNDSTALSAQFPAPTALPDVTFCGGTNYIGNNYNIGPHSGNHCWTMISFLGTCASAVTNLRFSHLPNPYLSNKPVTGSTSLGPGYTYGEMMELTGSINLTNGRPIMVCHDDGASLLIDGSPVPDLNLTSTGAFPTTCESATWTGTTGPHTYDLLYANYVEGFDAAWIQLLASK
jgi:hypothetical protein